MYTKKGKRLLALFLSMLFLFAGCGEQDDKPFEQIFDKTVKTGGKPKITGLQESGENETLSVMITDFEAYESARNELKTTNMVEMPKVKEKMFEDNAYLLIVKFVSQIRDYKHQVIDISVDHGILTVYTTLEKDDQLMAATMGCYQATLVRLDKELVQDIEKVIVKTEYVDETGSSALAMRNKRALI